MRKLAISAALLASVTFAGTAQAAITVYTSQAAFTAATTAPGTDTFESLSITGPTASPITRTAGAYSYTATTTDLDPTGAFGFYGAGTNADHWLSTNYALDTVRFSNFTAGVSALGGLFFTSNLAGAFATGDVTLTATDSLGATVTRTITSSTTTSFLGFVSTGSMSNVTLAAIQPAGGATALFPTANNLTLARAAATGAVPEPATWAMLILGMAAIGYSMRRSNVKFDAKIKRMTAAVA